MARVCYTIAGEWRGESMEMVDPDAVLLFAMQLKGLRFQLDRGVHYYIAHTGYDAMLGVQVDRIIVSNRNVAKVVLRRPVLGDIGAAHGWKGKAGFTLLVFPTISCLCTASIKEQPVAEM